MRLTEDGLTPVWQGTLADRHVGHAHFWERALTRRQFLGTAAAAGGAAATAPLWMTQVAQASGGTPTPIPGGLIKLPLFHFRCGTHLMTPLNMQISPSWTTWHAGRASHLVSLQWHSSSAWIAWKRYHRDKGLICNACSRQSMIYVRAAESPQIETREFFS